MSYPSLEPYGPGYDYPYDETPKRKRSKWREIRDGEDEDYEKKDEIEIYERDAKHIQIP